MTFVDELRSARGSRVAVLHEFWTQYDPNQKRVYAFFEGHDDIIFFTQFIERYTTEDYRLYVYRCEGKRQVFETFSQITQRTPGARAVLFFVDKDLDDILGIPWPTDPRIFVTDVYSIENYIVTSAVLRKFYRDSVRLVNVNYDSEAILAQFDRQLSRFQAVMMSVVAWILAVRRAGEKPNLNNVEMRELCDLSDTCEIKTISGSRLSSLTRMTGVGAAGRGFRHLLPVTRELVRMPAKRIIRGKFEAWFFVEFWKRLIRQLELLSREASGKVSVKVKLEHSNFVALLAGYVEIPHSLELFLRAHLPSALEPTFLTTSSFRNSDSVIRILWRKIIGFFAPNQEGSVKQVPPE